MRESKKSRFYCSMLDPYGMSQWRCEVCQGLEGGVSVLEVRVEAAGFVVVLDALRSQYCTIRCVKNTKNCERYRHIFAPRIDSKGTHIQGESPLSSPPLHFWEKAPQEDAFAILAEETPHAAP